jgi:hypothetical protein
MEQSSLHVARTLPPPVRTALEQLLGRALRDNEAVSIHTYQPHEAPSPEQQRSFAAALRRHFSEVDQRAKDIPEDEQEAVVDEAIRSVRPGYRSVR